MDRPKRFITKPSRNVTTSSLDEALQKKAADRRENSSIADDISDLRAVFNENCSQIKDNDLYSHTQNQQIDTQNQQTHTQAQQTRT